MACYGKGATTFALFLQCFSIRKKLLLGFAWLVWLACVLLRGLCGAWLAIMIVTVCLFVFVLCMFACLFVCFWDLRRLIQHLEIKADAPEVAEQCCCLFQQKGTH
jgi:uncharacterized protein YneF (UPF0154 family)